MASDKNVKYRTAEMENKTEKFEDVESVDLVGDSDGEHMVLIVRHNDDRPNTTREDVTDLFSVEDA